MVDLLQCWNGHQTRKLGEHDEGWAGHASLLLSPLQSACDNKEGCTHHWYSPEVGVAQWAANLGQLYHRYLLGSQTVCNCYLQLSLHPQNWLSQEEYSHMSNWTMRLQQHTCYQWLGRTSTSLTTSRDTTWTTHGFGVGGASLLNWGPMQWENMMLNVPLAMIPESVIWVVLTCWAWARYL